MTSALDATLLGVVQGLTEFLPVSSSGHLVLAQEALGVEHEDISFELAVHLGTLLPIFLVYFSDLKQMAMAPFVEKGTLSERPATRLLLLLILGSIPTALIGLLGKDFFESLFASSGPLVISFAITGTLLYATRFAPKGDKAALSLPWQSAVLIGIAQGLAITPGISRSGTTIAVALFLGTSRNFAARFSFLLAIPAILGAVLLQAMDIEGSASLDWTPLGIGAVVAAVVGYVALKLLLKLVNSGDFSKFAWYCWGMALVALGVWVS
jgi:undecaprenyl-diphosphatase